MSTDERPIEFLAPRDGAFGESGGADFVGFDGDDGGPAFGDDGPRSRWLTALAVVGVTGLLAGGVIAAAPWDSPQAAVPGPSTTEAAPSTTVRAPSATPSTEPEFSSPVEPVGYIISGWGDLVFTGAYSARPGDQNGGSDRLEIWAEPGATRLSGRWLAFTSLNSQFGSEEIRPEATRVALNEARALVSVDVDGVVRILVDPDDGSRFDLTGGGFGLDELIDIAATLRFAGAEFDLSNLPTSGLAPMSRIVTQRNGRGGFEGLIYGSVDAGAWWRTPDSSGGVSAIRRPSPTATDELIIEFLFPRIEFPSDRFIAHSLPGYPSTVIVEDAEDAAVLLMADNVEVGRLAELARNIRLATADEWVQLIADSEAGVGLDEQNYIQPTTIGSGSLDDGSWYVEVRPEIEFALIRALRSGWGGRIGPIEAKPALRTFSSMSTTSVMVTARAPDPTTELRVTFDGQPPITVAMVEVRGSDIVAGAFAYEDDSTYTVELLNDAGEVIGVVS